MGIKNLNKILNQVSNIYSIKENYTMFKNVINEIELENTIKNSVCHIDIAIYVYKYLFSSSNLLEACEKISNGISEIKENNKILIYIDPKKNIRKVQEKKIRQKQQNIQKEKILDRLKTKINILKKVSECQEEIKSTQEIIKSLEVTNKTNEDILNILSKIDSKITSKKNNDNINEFFDVELMDFDEEVSEDIIENKLDISNSENKLDVSNSENKIPQTEINIDNDLFKFCLYNVSMIFFNEYIIEYLIHNQIITEDEIVRSEYLDAEIKIVENIKNNYPEEKNIIFSTDQDVILFYFYHIHGKHLLIKPCLSNKSFDLKIINFSYRIRNICLLTAFFNKTDYFPGLTKTTLTEKRILDFQNSVGKKTLNRNVSLEIILGTYVRWYSIKNKINNSEVYNISEIEEYIKDFKLFLETDKNFFVKKTHSSLSIESLLFYFKEKKTQYLIKNVSDKVVLNKFF